MPPSKGLGRRVALVFERHKTMKLIAFAVIALMAGAQAQAATHSYSTPTNEGQRIGVCLSDGVSCGKIAADQFCKMQGYTESILFAREPVTTAQSIDNGQVCTGNTCQALKRVKCYQPLEQADQQPATLQQ
jgi:hypothetical protein